MQMRTVALSEAKDKLSALVEEASTTHEVIEITRHGHAAAVLMSADDLEALTETVHLLSQPGALDELRQAETDVAASRYTTAAELRARYGLTPR